MYFEMYALKWHVRYFGTCAREPIPSATGEKGSPDAISLSLDEVSTLSDEAARQFLAAMRWGRADQQVCPHCGSVGKHYNGSINCKNCRLETGFLQSPLADILSDLTEIETR